jgi:subtilisin family serine protease
VDILPIRVCGSDGGELYNQSKCKETNVIRGICHALRIAYDEGYTRDVGIAAPSQMLNLVINLSMGSYTPTDVLRNFIGAAEREGAVIVSAAGNDPQTPSPTEDPPVTSKTAYQQGTVVFPAGYGIPLPVRPGSRQPAFDIPSVDDWMNHRRGIDGVVGVASLELPNPKVNFPKVNFPWGLPQDGTNYWRLADSSIWGAHVTLAAPGRQVSMGKSLYSGTSFAAPYVSGYVAALRKICQVFPAKAQEKLKEISGSVSLLFPYKTHPGMGAGIIKPDIPLTCP